MRHRCEGQISPEMSPLFLAVSALLALICAPSTAGYWISAVPPAATRQYDPLEVVIFFEALCPDCQDFMQGSFADAWRAVPQILNVTLVPWGFATAAKVNGRWKFKCQHGPEECRGNRLHTCGVLTAPTPAASVTFSVCLESSEPEDMCADSSAISREKLKQCMEDPATDLAMLRYRDMTDAPPTVMEVPTVSVDGSRDSQDDMLDDFLRFVCRAWKGPPPPGCLQRLDIE